MNQSPILRALSSMRKSGARTLLMGGQACIVYGAAEFSRDLDVLVLAGAQDIAFLRTALEDLAAVPIAVPPFEARYLDRGHAVHFRCRREDVAGLRIDIMSVLRGCDGFEDLWSRRTTIDIEGELVDLLSLRDLVCAKKTQRDKDWPMIRRLMERCYLESGGDSEAGPIEFILSELRTPELLVEAVGVFRATAGKIAETRPAVARALVGDATGTAIALEEEERQQRALDREYWGPLKRELEELRHARKNGAVDQD